MITKFDDCIFNTGVFSVPISVKNNRVSHGIYYLYWLPWSLNPWIWPLLWYFLLETEYYWIRHIIKLPILCYSFRNLLVTRFREIRHQIFNFSVEFVRTVAGYKPAQQPSNPSTGWTDATRCLKRSSVYLPITTA